MRRILLLALPLAALAMATPRAWSAPEPIAYACDTIHSHVMFKVMHMGSSWSYGRFNEFSVDLKLAEGSPELSSVAFTVKAESVDTGNAKRDQHLRNPDFLNAKEFPEIVFRSTAVKASGPDGAEVTGNLTLHGVTKPVTVTVRRVGSGKGMKGETLVGFETVFTIKRSEFGMNHLVGPVGDEVTLTVAIEASR